MRKYTNLIIWSLVCGLVAQSCLTLATQRTIAHQAPLSVGFPRQDSWIGLPFPSPGDLPHPGTEPGSPTLQADPLPSEPPRKPKNTGVGSHSLLGGIFVTQRLNLTLLHCRQILYLLSHLGGLEPNEQCFIWKRGLRRHD